MANEIRTTPWEPIETAPKDGTTILAYAIDDAEDTQPQIIRWVKEVGWTVAWDGYFWEHEPFTHWMPLPEAPHA